VFVKGGKLVYAYNFLGISPEQRVEADAPSSGTHIVGVEFTKETTGEHHEPHGPLRIFVDDEMVAEGEIRELRRATACAARGCASATTAATRSRATTSRNSSSQAARSSRSSST
jgi:hypothetical protein